MTTMDIAKELAKEAERSLTGAPRTRQRRAGPVIAGVAVVGLLAACSQSGRSASSASCKASDIPIHDARTIIIEGDPWSGYAPFRDDHLLNGSGYTSRYVEQICQDVRASDVRSGRAGIEVTTLDQYLLNHPDGTVVGVIDQSEGADALALNTVEYPNLRSIDNLTQLIDQYKAQNKKPVLAYTGNSPSEMLLNELANTFEELNLADFNLVSVDQSATAYNMLRTQQAQLAIIWEPDTSAARASGYTIALSSKNVPDSIVDKKKRPTALVAMSDIIAIGVMAGLHDGGLRVPRDISIVGIDDLYLAALVSPAITSIRQPVPEIAEAMVGRLIKRIETPTLAPAEQVFRPALVVRNSVRKIGGSP